MFIEMNVYIINNGISKCVDSDNSYPSMISNGVMFRDQTKSVSLTVPLLSEPLSMEL